MMVPKLACGLAVAAAGGVALMGLTTLAVAGAGAAYLLRKRMQQSTDWAEEYRKPVAGLPPDPE